MSTKIEWATDTWNPITGCSKISEGCANCYAERMSKRLAGRFGYPRDNPFTIALHGDKLEGPLKWRKPRRIFVCSMSDLFHEDVPNEWIDKVMEIIIRSEQHIFIILTKRPRRMHSYFTDIAENKNNWLDRFMQNWHYPSMHGTFLSMRQGKPIPNLWLGVTAENQQRADERIPILLQISAAKRFVSVEPMLGPVDLTFDAGAGKGLRDSFFNYGLDWVICGGETGHGARPMHPDWVRSLRDQCTAAGVPFFFKQWGEWAPWGTGATPTHKLDLKHSKCCVLDQNNHAFNVGKKKAGRLLDGREWNQYPEVTP